MSDLRGVPGNACLAAAAARGGGAGRAIGPDGAGGRSDDRDGYAADTNAADERDDRDVDVPADRATLTGEGAWAGFVRTSFTNRSLAVVCLWVSRQFRNRAGVGSHRDVGAGRHGAGRRERNSSPRATPSQGPVAAAGGDDVRQDGGRRRSFSACSAAPPRCSSPPSARMARPRSVGVGVSPDELKQLQFGISSSPASWGSSQVLCPVLAAAAADHSPRSGFAASVGTVRFWRDGIRDGVTRGGARGRSSTETRRVRRVPHADRGRGGVRGVRRGFVWGLRG